MSPLAAPSAAPRDAGAAPALLPWALRQAAALVLGLLMAAGGGIVRRMWQRQFDWAGWAWAMAVLALGAAIGAGILQLPAASHPAARLPALAAVVLFCAALAGAVLARRRRTLALWELYLAVAASAAIAVAALGHSPADADPYGPPLAWGPRYLGPLWDHMLALGAPLALMAALIGSSAALMFAGQGQPALGLALPWRLATRHLSHRRRGPSTTALITVVGVALGVASLITVTAVMSGYQQDIEGKILSTNAHLVVQKYGVDFSEHGRIAQAIAEVPGVVGTSPFAFNEAMLSVNGRGLGVLLKGIDPLRAAHVTDTARHVCLNHRGAAAGGPAAPAAGCEHAGDAGAAVLAELLRPGEGPAPLVVGLSLFRRLGVPLGTPVVLLTPVGMAGARGGAPRRMPFVLAGVFASGMHEFDAHLVVTGLGAAQALLGLGDAVSGIECRVARADDVDAVGAAVLARIGHYPYRALDWRQLNGSIFMALTLQKVVMFLVLACIVVVAAFNIASTLFMAVVEKAEQIAVLKSMGATDATIMRVFVLEGWLTGMAGTVLGVALGLGAAALLARLQLALAADVYMIERLTVRIEPSEVLLTIGAALAICHLSTLYPALQAARARPVDVLRQG